MCFSKPLKPNPFYCTFHFGSLSFRGMSQLLLALALLILALEFSWEFWGNVWLHLYCGFATWQILYNLAPLNRFIFTASQRHGQQGLFKTLRIATVLLHFWSWLFEFSWDVSATSGTFALLALPLEFSWDVSTRFGTFGAWPIKTLRTPPRFIALLVLILRVFVGCLD